MSDLTLKRLVFLALALLLVHQIGAMIAGLFGMAWGAVSALVVAAVSFVSVRLAKAGGKSSAWFLLPTLLFTLLPLAISLWNAATAQTSAWERMIALAPLTIGFLLPVALLLAVFLELHKRARNAA